MTHTQAKPGQIDQMSLSCLDSTLLLIILLSDNDCHKYIFDVTILVFNPQFVYVKCVTNTLVYVGLQDASSYARI